MRDYAALLHLRGQWRVAQLPVAEDDLIASRPLGQLHLPQEGVAVLRGATVSAVDQTPIYDELLDQLCGGSLSATAALPWSSGKPPAVDLFGTASGGGRRADPAASVNAGGRHRR